MPRKRVDVNDYDRTKNGRGEHVREHSRMQDVRGEARPSMNSIRRQHEASLMPAVIGGQTIPKVMIPSDAKIREGSYTTGFGLNPPPPSQREMYLDTDKVVIDGIVFDENTEFEWQDPDFLSSVDEEFARSGEHPNWVDEYNAGTIDLEEESGLQEFYHFKAGGPTGVGYRITGDGEVQIFPKDTALGRIPLWEKRYSGDSDFPGDEIVWRQRGEAGFHGRGGAF